MGALVEEVVEGFVALDLEVVVVEGSGVLLREGLLVEQDLRVQQEDSPEDLLAEQDLRVQQWDL